MYLFTIFWQFKVIPPLEYTVKSKSLPKGYILRDVVRQKTKKNSNSFEISYENKTTMALKDFEVEAMKNTHGLNLKNVSEYEDAFWSSLGGEEEHLYGIDNNISLFNKCCKHWNLNRFSSTESLIHDNADMPGITKPYLYVGSMFTAFGIHEEDANHNSLNFHHAGAIKLWYLNSL